MMKGILGHVNRASKIWFCFFLFACESNENYKLVSTKIIGGNNYIGVFNQIKDSINNWTINKLGYYKYCGENKNCYLDSLLCFNSSQNRFIGALLKQQLLKDGVADNIDYMYGEKINGKWYFFSGANIFIPRNMVKGHDVHKPLSYQQLHEIALKEIYGGYLKRNGEINEEWFTNQFEGTGWVHWDDTPEKIKKYTRKDYENFHLEVIRNNWYIPNHDSTKSIEKNKSIP